MDELLSLLQDKKGLLKYVLKTIMDSDKYMKGLSGMQERGFSDKGMLEKVVQVSAIQSNRIKHLALICLLLIQSEKFDFMVAETAMKLSNDGGEAVLRQMFENKLKGK